MKAMLVWSDGTTISTHIFEDKDGKTGYERAVEQMHQEYDDHNSYGNAREDLGAFRGNDSCRYSAEDEDMCSWQVERLPEEKVPVISRNLSQADRCELFGLLIDAVEDWLEEKGVTPAMIPNEEREDENSAIIYGTDYDCLADKFSAILGIDRDAIENNEKNKDSVNVRIVELLKKYSNEKLYHIEECANQENCKKLDERFDNSWLEPEEVSEER